MGKGEIGLCVASGELLFLLPAKRLLYILSSDALQAAVDEENRAVWEGQAVRVVSLRALLGLPPGKERHALLLKEAGGAVGLLVDEVLDAFAALPGGAMAMPPSILWEANSFLQGVLPLQGQGRLAYLVDVARLLTAAEGGQ
ncbi:chemotaxis protein CheW [Acetanaerobacterium sp. MSJ-12]|uniref:chemotaxis protein CheW n=1 Tax=Acetanaerobacterium sp. MSJ-12 TaxID=2841535 RepID=UPI001C0F269A|nr:chemotaxis protein CheW [Acetanaerobacterium sp. MSJ-12]MBU5420702.1 chemotaxis protein CheW [Acetanaerobacterium sp. MSJ-12]